MQDLITVDVMSCRTCKIRECFFCCVKNYGTRGFFRIIEVVDLYGLCSVFFAKKRAVENCGKSHKIKSGA